MQPTVIGGITQDQFNRYRERAARDFGITLPQTNQGSYAAYGVEIAWNYNPAGQTVTLECTKKPFWVPQSLIDQHIQQEITKLQGAA